MAGIGAPIGPQMDEFNEFAPTPQESVEYEGLDPSAIVTSEISKGHLGSLPSSIFSGDSLARRSANAMFGIDRDSYKGKLSPDEITARIRSKLDFDKALAGNKEQRGTSDDALTAVREQFKTRMAPLEAKRTEILTEMFGPANAETLVAMKEINPTQAALALGAASAAIIQGKDPSQAIEFLAAPIKEALLRRQEAKAARDKMLGIEYEQVTDEMGFERKQYQDELNAEQQRQRDEQITQRNTEIEREKTERTEKTLHAQALRDARKDIRQAILTGDPNRIGPVIAVTLKDFPELADEIGQIVPKDLQPTIKQSLDQAKIDAQKAETERKNQSVLEMKESWKYRLGTMKWAPKIAELKFKADAKGLEYLGRSLSLGIIERRARLRKLEQDMRLNESQNLRDWYRAYEGNDLAWAKLSYEQKQGAWDAYKALRDEYEWNVNAVAALADKIAEASSVQGYDPGALQDMRTALEDLRGRVADPPQAPPQDMGSPMRNPADGIRAGAAAGIKGSIPIGPMPRGGFRPINPPGPGR